MARMSLWTPLLVIFTIQLLILLYLNLRTSKTSDGDLVSLHVSPFDRVVKGGSRNEGKAGPGAALLGMVQIGAPASEISRERRNNGESRILYQTVRGERERVRRERERVWLARLVTY